MINEAWLNDVMEIQGEVLVSVLKEASEFTELPVISSVLSEYSFQSHFNGYYSIVPKLTEIPLKERVEIAIKDDPNDSYSVVMDLIYERRTCGDITDHEEEETLAEWATESGVPLYRFDATIFTNKNSLLELPFNGFDFGELTKRIFDQVNFQPGTLSLITTKGLVESYPLPIAIKESGE